MSSQLLARPLPKMLWKCPIPRCCQSREPGGDSDATPCAALLEASCGFKVLAPLGLPYLEMKGATLGCVCSPLTGVFGAQTGALKKNR